MQVLEEILFGLLQRFKLGRTSKKVKFGRLVRAPQDTSSLLAIIIIIIIIIIINDEIVYEMNHI